MHFRPHNHLMWAAIGLNGGQEDNTFYRRDGFEHHRVRSSSARNRNVVLLGDDTIDAVTNPTATYIGAIHIYGGNITARPGRSEWQDDTLVEIPNDYDRARQHFEAANSTSRAE